MRTSGYTPNFRMPSSDTPSRSMWITIALCLALPPIGLIRLWATARCPLRGKLIISIIGVLSMTLMLTLYLSLNRPNPYLSQAPQSQLPSVTSPQTLQTPAAQTDATPAPADPNAGAQTGAQGTTEDPSLIPANPALGR